MANFMQSYLHTLYSDASSPLLPSITTSSGNRTVLHCAATSSCSLTDMFIYMQQNVVQYRSFHGPWRSLKPRSQP